MLDGLGRKISYLRVSITDRCNLRCAYCMPPEGVEWMEHSDILSYEELIRLCSLFAELGIDRVRLTGGEPLVRRDLDRIVRGVNDIPGIDKVTLTTNGVLLAKQLPALMEAGLDGVNISLDTLDRAQFEAITRRDELPAALEGLNMAASIPGLNLKVNCVPMGENDDQLVPIALLAKDRDIAVRYIELMPIGRGGSMTRRNETEILKILEAALGPCVPGEPVEGGGPGKYVSFKGFRGKIGFISAMTHKFCNGCNRVRLTSTGFLKTCLQFENGTDLKALIDGGADDETLKAAICDAILQKPSSHHFTEAAADNNDEKKNMYQIGG